MEDIAKMSYSEFSEYFHEHYDDFEIILEYNDFIVYREIDSIRYFFYKTNETNTDDFYELEIVASLWFDDHNFDNVPKDEDLISLFEHDCCGECYEMPIGEQGSIFYWFKKKED